MRRGAARTLRIRSKPSRRHPPCRSGAPAGLCSVYGSLTRVYTRGVHSKWGCWRRGPLPALCPARAVSPLVDSVPDGARRRFRPVGPIRVCARVTAPHLRLQTSRGGSRASPAAATRPSRRVWAIEKRTRSRTSARHTGHLSTWVVKHGNFSHEYRALGQGSPRMVHADLTLKLQHATGTGTDPSNQKSLWKISATMVFQRPPLVGVGTRPS